jgi:hypothetical protein
MDHLTWKFAFVAAVFFAVGFITATRLRDPTAQPSPPGWVCWDVTQTTAAGSRHNNRCDPAPGWHIEEWPDVGQVAVPNHAMVVRRYPRD